MLSEYIKVLELGDKSVHTIRSYKRSIKTLYGHFNITENSQLDGLSVSDFHKLYMAQKLSPNSLNGLIRNLNAYFVWLTDSGYIKEGNLIFKVKFGKSRFVRVKRKPKKVLTNQESESLVSAGRNKQEKFMLALMVTTGLRRDEVSKIKTEDINGSEIIITGKGGDQRFTYMNDMVMSMFNDYVENERDTTSEFLFYGTRGESTVDGGVSPTSINERVKSCAEIAGLSDVTAHRLRATAITQATLEFGIKGGQILAGHADIKTTELYVNIGKEYVREMLLGK